MTATKFEKHFDRYACEGDTIAAGLSAGKWSTGLRFVATIHRDDCSDRPDERDEGFWPSLDPKAAGYIGNKTQRTLARHMAKATAAMESWKADEWFYCGIAVRAYFDEIPLTGEFDFALWGIECNFPAKNSNAYLQRVANDLLDECAQAAIASLTGIVEKGAETLELVQ